MTTLSSPTPTACTDAWATADSLLATMDGLPRTDPTRHQLRSQVICQCAPEAQREARRYRRTGEPLDDLLQVATLGLILAVDRYQPRRGIAFKHFALPTISGELKRHFRDKTWGVRVSRRVQELYREVRINEPQLAQKLGRTPTTSDLAAELELSEHDIRSARIGEAAYTTRSLNYPVTADTDSAELGELLGGPDNAIESIADRDALQRAWPLLPERSRTILTLRFVDELSQNQIADKLNISQMHVSRLITRALLALRRHMTAETAFANSRPPG